jgi:hypothetical protein
MHFAVAAKHRHVCYWIAAYRSKCLGVGRPIGNRWRSAVSAHPRYPPATALPMVSIRRFAAAGGNDHGDPNYYKNKPRKPTRDDPFAILGVSEEESYAAVKRTFLQIALRHHPDTATSATSAEADASREIFISARKAFEQLAEGPEGLAVLASDGWEEEELDVWFKDETGFDMPFMDAATMKEVAEMHDTTAHGLDRDGGMWTLARMVTENVKSGGNAGDLLRLEAGTIRDRGIDGILRRRRRR